MIEIALLNDFHRSVKRVMTVALANGASRMIHGKKLLVVKFKTLKRRISNRFFLLPESSKIFEVDDAFTDFCYFARVKL